MIGLKVIFAILTNLYDMHTFPQSLEIFLPTNDCINRWKYWYHKPCL